MLKLFRTKEVKRSCKKEIEIFLLILLEKQSVVKFMSTIFPGQ